MSGSVNSDPRPRDTRQVREAAALIDRGEVAGPEANIGLGRIVALYHRYSTLYQIH